MERQPSVAMRKLGGFIRALPLPCIQDHGIVSCLIQIPGTVSSEHSVLQNESNEYDLGT